MASLLLVLEGRHTVFPPLRIQSPLNIFMVNRRLFAGWNPFPEPLEAGEIDPKYSCLTQQFALNHEGQKLVNDL